MARPDVIDAAFGISVSMGNLDEYEERGEKGTYGYARKEFDQGVDERLADAVWFCEVCAF